MINIYYFIHASVKRCQLAFVVDQFAATICAFLIVCVFYYLFMQYAYKISGIT